MKKLLLILLIVSVSFTGVFANGSNEGTAAPQAEVNTQAVQDAVNTYFAEMPSYSYIIKAPEVFEKINSGYDMVLIDIRKPEDYAKGHLKGAVNIPWGMELYNQLKYIPRDKDVYVNCYSGQTAGQAVMLLNAAGVQARSIHYGWNFGISKAEGYEAYSDTAEYTLDTSKTYETDPAIDMAYRAYYEEFASLKGTPFASNIVSEANAKKILDSGDSDVVFVSIRKAKDYAAGHIAGASNIPWGKGMNEMFSSLPADKKIIIYCYSGQTAGQTVAGLKLLGYDAVSLKGGMGTKGNPKMGWKNNGYPVVSSN